jgi:twinkle protein
MEEIKTGLVRVTLKEVKDRGKFTERETFRFHCLLCGDEENHRRRCDGSFNQRLGVGQCFCCGTRYVLDRGFQGQSQKTAPTTASLSRSVDGKQPKVIGGSVCLGDYPADIMEYLKKRSIRADVMHLLGVGYAKRHSDGDPSRGIPAEEKTFLAFRFLEKGELRNVQYKSLDKEFQFEAGCKLIPWNIDDAFDSEVVYITEGMMDAAALVQCGYAGVISLPNGTGTKMSCFDQFRKSHFEGKRIVYAGDTDEAGIKKRIEVARYFPANDFYYVEWTVSSNAEVKDANDVLMAEGEDAVRRCVDSPKAMPIVGVATIDDQKEAFSELVVNGVPRFPGVSHLFGFTHMVRFEPGRMMVISGVPGTGKSTFSDNLVMMLAVEQKWRAAVYSPEKYPMSLHYYELGQILMGQELSSKNLTPQAVERGEQFLRENIFHISDECSQIEDILGIAAQLVFQKGIRVLLIDPFNYVDLPVMSGATDTQKISMVLKQIVAFARTYKVLVIVVAHPRKPQTDGRDKQGLSSVPSLYDIAGSADFYNKCDYGIILQREKPTDNQKRLPLTWIHVQKVRFRHLGQIGRRAFGFDPTSGRFVGTENDNMTLKPYDRSDWSYIEAEQQDIEWPDDDDPEAETAEDDLPF